MCSKRLLGMHNLSIAATWNAHAHHHPLPGCNPDAAVNVQQAIGQVSEGGHLPVSFAHLVDIQLADRLAGIAAAPVRFMDTIARCFALPGSYCTHMHSGA